MEPKTETVVEKMIRPKKGTRGFFGGITFSHSAPLKASARKRPEKIKQKIGLGSRRFFFCGFSNRFRNK